MLSIALYATIFLSPSHPRRTRIVRSKIFQKTHFPLSHKNGASSNPIAALAYQAFHPCSTHAPHIPPPRLAHAHHQHFCLPSKSMSMKCHSVAERSEVPANLVPGKSHYFGGAPKVPQKSRGAKHIWLGGLKCLFFSRGGLGTLSLPPRKRSFYRSQKCRYFIFDTRLHTQHACLTNEVLPHRILLGGRTNFFHLLGSCGHSHTHILLGARVTLFHLQGVCGNAHIHYTLGGHD